MAKTFYLLKKRKNEGEVSLFIRHGLRERRDGDVVGIIIDRSSDQPTEFKTKRAAARVCVWEKECQMLATELCVHCVRAP